MDQIFTEMSDSFTFDEIYDQCLTDTFVTSDEVIAKNPNRIKLLVVRAVQELVSVGMLRERESELKRYFFCWQEDTDNH